MAQQMQQVPIGTIHPYGNNPRDNTQSVDKVAESIRNFGFLQPIVCDDHGIILAGHTRYRAAKKLGLPTVPVIYARNLTPEQAKAYRLADNKAGEDSLWLNDLLAAEMDDISLDMSQFGFEDPNEYTKRESWKVSAKLCDMKQHIVTREKAGFFYTTFFATGKKGRPLEEIKADPNAVRPFAFNLADYLERSLGDNLARNRWCICTTPRRRHQTGFHFATEICKLAEEELGIPFYEDVVLTKNRSRIEPEFVLNRDPVEPNVILFDDIITTGITIRETRQLLLEKGHTVLVVVAIRNQ